MGSGAWQTLRLRLRLKRLHVPCSALQGIANFEAQGFIIVCLAGNDANTDAKKRSGRK